MDLSASKRLVHQLAEQGRAVSTLARIGLLDPRVGIASGKATRAWGPTPAAGFEATARRLPHHTALVDDQGPMSAAEVDAQSNALANALAERGIGPDTPVALLSRNHRGFVLSATAVSKIGAPTLYLNTGFAGPQVAEVLGRENAHVVIYDTDMAGVIEGFVDHLDLITTDGTGLTSLPILIASATRRRPDPPAKPGPQIILTSGTTGTPKGAKRPTPKGLVAVTAMFQRIPWKVADVHLIAAPMFHALGNGAFQIAAQFSQTMVLPRRFDPEDTLRLIEQHRVTGVTVVPVMLQRILALPGEVTDRYDLSTMTIVQCSGAALPGSLATQWMDRFGENLYNVFASTEVGAATIATPADMRAAPGTAGRPVPGSVVRLFDEHDKPVNEPGTVGRIFVGNDLAFEGYTSGETKAQIDGLLSIGDVGWFDDDGRLFVGGRDDDMIVSGGENVYPREVENLLADLPGVAEVAVVGVDDTEFGQRLAAFVVCAPEATLDATAIKDHVRSHLATYKVPRDVVFLDELPRNETGKVLAKELHAH